jgi:hypothetical protein
VVTEQAQLAVGTADTTVRMDRPGLVVLSASFDPGWQVTVDGRPATPVMVAPALVAVWVAPGAHRVVFRYAGYAGYPVLMILSALVLTGGFVADRWWASRRRPWPDVSRYPPDAVAAPVPAPADPAPEPAVAPAAPPDSVAPVDGPAPELPVPVDPEFDATAEPEPDDAPGAEPPPPLDAVAAPAP